MRGRNPLRRTSDRIQAWSAVFTIMTLLVLTPWVAWYVARETYGDDVRADAWEREHRFPVPAVLLENPPQPGGTAGDGPPPPAVPARASWFGPDGVHRTGTITADPGQRAGATQMIWVDEHGAVASAPRTRNPGLHAFMAAVFAAGGLVGGLAGLHRILVWRLDRRRLRDWQAQWLIFEPQWRRR